MARTLRLILGDQLNASHSWYKESDSDILYVIAELRQETDYVKHHVQKVCAFFAAMERFAQHLTDQGHKVEYLTLDDTAQWDSLPDMLAALVKDHEASRFEYQRPDEYRLAKQLEEMTLPSGVETGLVETEHFYLDYDELDDFFVADEHVRMESFYRRLRRRFNILMDDDRPRGGRWNFDSENRQRLRVDDIEVLPEPLLFSNDVSAILKRLKKHGVDHFGTAHEHLVWPVDRQQSLRLLRHFCTVCLPCFGRFQDAMTGHSDHRWSLYHSRLSFALNSKLIAPQEVVEAALERFESDPETVDIAQAEGFIRQVLGWREYIRGVYWANMPSYADRNKLNARRNLPDFFWTGETKMRCLQQAIEQSLEYAYAHHIQRLMVTGNFCMLAGIDPNQVDEWYLGIYIDALQWVELPNTRGMSQYADGGLVATKPYAASGNYINKMSDYCKDCHYKVKEKTGEDACPLNSLYWDFMVRHRELLAANHRIGMIYRSWDKMAEQTRSDVLSRAKWIRQHLDSL